MYLCIFSWSYIVKQKLNVKYIVISFIFFSETTFLIHQFHFLKYTLKKILIDKIFIRSGDTLIG